MCVRVNTCTVWVTKNLTFCNVITLLDNVFMKFRNVRKYESCLKENSFVITNRRLLFRCFFYLALLNL